LRVIAGQHISQDIPQRISSATLPVPRGVRRALDAMRSNIGHNWRLAELAAIAGTSGRTLQRQFLSFVGKTPRAVLREIALECARRELLQGAPASRSWMSRCAAAFPISGGSRSRIAAATAKRRRRP
jgi:transcriptional regulator GlxA family with amidase domain